MAAEEWISRNLVSAGVESELQETWFRDEEEELRENADGGLVGETIDAELMEA